MQIKFIEATGLDQYMKETQDLHQSAKRLLNRFTETGNEWLDSSDVCRQLDISKRTLQTFRDNRVLSFSQVGHKTYYKKADVDGLMDYVRDYRKDAKNQKSHNTNH